MQLVQSRVHLAEESSPGVKRRSEKLDPRVGESEEDRMVRSKHPFSRLAALELEDSPKLPIAGVPIWHRQRSIPKRTWKISKIRGVMTSSSNSGDREGASDASVLVAHWRVIVQGVVVWAKLHADTLMKPANPLAAQLKRDAVKRRATNPYKIFRVVASSSGDREGASDA
jgi:hypothetical protein